MNRQITHNFISQSFQNSNICFAQCMKDKSMNDDKYINCLDSCNTKFIQLMSYINQKLPQYTKNIES